MKRPCIFCLSLLLVLVFTSCKTQQRALGYLENLGDSTQLNSIRYQEPLIQKNDQLAITIYSKAADDGRTDAWYNVVSATGGSASGAPAGYIVDNDGNILHPRIGLIKAEGLTKPQLAEAIKRKINEKDSVLTHPVVIVKLLNFRVTMLGEVAKPGPITLPGERINILEAVGLAGDLSIYGKKDDIVVIREVDGKVEYGKVDLSSKSIFQSPYFYLRQNDVVLVNPNKNKARLNDQVFNQRMGIAFSIINTIALLYNIFR
jgi:polysaccharide export outer membrane protein